MNYPQSIVFINIRYTFIFYFQKIFCPNFSVKIFLIHKSNVLSDLQSDSIKYKDFQSLVFERLFYPGYVAMA